jgi:hypothetical protein
MNQPSQLKLTPASIDARRRRINQPTVGLTNNDQQVTARTLASVIHGNVNGPLTPSDLNAAARSVSFSQGERQCWLSPDPDPDESQATDQDVYAELARELNWDNT